MAAPYRWVDEPGTAGIEPGATVVSSFPSAGLAATVAAHYAIQTLKLPRIGTLESPDAVPVAVVQGGEVQPPIRVYGRGNFAVIVSEFPPTFSTIQALGTAILDGAEARKARALVCLEGVVPNPVEEEESGDAAHVHPPESVWAVLSRPDDASRAALAAARIRSLDAGVIGGLSGVLLVRGLHRALPVEVLLVSAHDTVGYPDHRAGAALIEALDRLLPEISIDTGPLRGQAEMIERLLRSAMKNRPPASPEERAAKPEGTMYG